MLFGLGRTRHSPQNVHTLSAAVCSDINSCVDVMCEHCYVLCVCTSTSTCHNVFFFLQCCANTMAARFLLQNSVSTVPLFSCCCFATISCVRSLFFLYLEHNNDAIETFDFKQMCWCGMNVNSVSIPFISLCFSPL